MKKAQTAKEMEEKAQIKEELQLAVTQKDSHSYSSNLEKVTRIIDNDITYLDVSDLTGEYYIQFGIGSCVN